MRFQSFGSADHPSVICGNCVQSISTSWTIAAAALDPFPPDAPL